VFSLPDERGSELTTKSTKGTQEKLDMVLNSR